MCGQYNGVTGWKTFSIVSLNDFFPQARELGQAVFTMVVIAVLIAAVVILLLTYTFTRPIGRLTAAMKEIEEGNFEIRVANKNHDEMGRLTGAFNYMISKTDHLIKEVYQEKIAQKNAELEALQAQINPHFLYNTLDSINWMLIDIGADEIRDVIVSLGDILKYSIQGNPDADFWKLFFPALSSMIAFDGGIALSMADFARNCRTQKAQLAGQLAGAPVMTAFIAFVGICGTAGASLAFHEPIWEPAVLVSKFQNPVIVIIFSLFIIMAVLALLAQPRNALASAYDLIYNICGLLGALLGPISGLYLVAYLFEHKTHVDLVDLYREDGGRYYYKGGWNMAIITIFLAATAVIIAGKYIAPLSFLFDNAYVIGSIGAGLIYFIYLKIQEKRERKEAYEDNHQTRNHCVTQ